MPSRTYRYVGPESIRASALANIHRTHIKSPEELRQWLMATEPHGKRRAFVPVTFIIDTTGQLWITDRRSEHVACANGGDVLAAGELVLSEGRKGVEIIEATNQSTGYCPEPECWQEVAVVLDALGISHPAGFTTEFTFRRCDECGARNLVKDEVFECAVCGAELSLAWNFAAA